MRNRVTPGADTILIEIKSQMIWEEAIKLVRERGGDFSGFVEHAVFDQLVKYGRAVDPLVASGVTKRRPHKL